MQRFSECIVGLYHILSRLGGLEEHRKLPSGVWGGAAPPQAQTLLGRFVRNSVRFYMCFSAFWKLAVIDNNTKSGPTYIRKYNCGW